MTHAELKASKDAGFWLGTRCALYLSKQMP